VFDFSHLVLGFGSGFFVFHTTIANVHTANDEEARKVLTEHGAEASSGGFGSVTKETGELLSILDQLYHRENVGPVITRVVPFDAEIVAQAERDNLSGKICGKVVVEIK
jgi:NADPH:quinone reductase-like Zn-dependent oxidoreductase